MQMMLTNKESLYEITQSGIDHFFHFSELEKGSSTTNLFDLIIMIYTISEKYLKKTTLCLVQKKQSIFVLCLRCIGNEIDVTTRGYSRIGLND